MLISYESFFAYIGSAHDGIACITREHVQQAWRYPLLQQMRDYGAQSFYFLTQTHSSQGALLFPDQPTPDSFVQQGDYIITQKKGCAIGVLTADCMPLVLFDPVEQAIAVIHAGWRGTVAGIVKNALEHMMREYKTDPAHVQCIIGPCARACCYTVGTEVVEAFSSWTDLKNTAIIARNDQRFCDLVGFNSALLRSMGVAKKSIIDYNYCTIENPTFFSYRRQRENAGRQMMLICLR